MTFDSTRGDDLGLAPPLIHSDFSRSLSEWFDFLAVHYRPIVGDAGISLWGRPVCGWGGKAADGRPEGLWHLITRETGGGRQLDLARCAALARVWDVLELSAAGDPRVLWWRETRRHGRHLRRHLMVAPADFSLVIVLRETPERFVLLTAYPVKPHRRRSFAERAAAAWASGQARLEQYARRPTRPPETWRPPAAGRRRPWGPDW